MAQLLTPFIRLLNTYSEEFFNTGKDKYYVFRDLLLRGYFVFWTIEKTLDAQNLRFDGYYHNFYNYR
ncbi:MAG: hypothetical protein ACFFBY_06475 [Promethearchaeota archaeon]